jgi:hypothetical protein
LPFNLFAFGGAGRAEFRLGAALNFPFFCLVVLRALLVLGPKHCKQLQVCRYHQTYHFSLHGPTYLRHTCRFSLFSAGPDTQLLALPYKSIHALYQNKCKGQMKKAFGSL